MYGLLVWAEQPQSLCQVMNSINTVGYWKRPGHTRSHLNSSFPFSPFSIFWHISNKWYCFCPSLPSLPSLSLLSTHPTPLCVTFNEMKGMQECTGNTWRSTFERLRLTNDTRCRLGFVSPFPSLHRSTRARGCGNEHCNRGEIRIGCELSWRLVCSLKTGKQREGRGTGEQWERRSRLKSQRERIVLRLLWRRIRMIEQQNWHAK